MYVTDVPCSFGNELITMKMEYGCTFLGFVLSFVLTMIKNGPTVSVSIIERNNTVFENRNMALLKHTLISSLNGSDCCKKDCISTRSGLEITTNCDGALCQCVPYEQIPKQTTKLSICHNKLVAIRIGSFEMFSDLEVLLLNNNIIRVIEAEAFFGLKKLLLLDLSDNPTLIALPDNIFSALHSLQTLMLKSVSASCDSFNPKAFDNMTNLRNLSFSLNRQFSFPKFDANHSSIMPSLEILDLSRNNMKELLKAHFDHLKSVRVLLLNNNDIRSIGRMCFIALERLEILNLEHNLIFKLQSSSFWSKSLQLLNLADTSIKINQQDNFKHLPNLKHLILKNCKFLSKAKLESLLRNLTNLTRLNLQHCKLRSIQVKRLLKPLRNLDNLWLSGNYIIDLDRTIFEPFAESLKVLQLNDNKLSTINITSLPTKLWTSLDKMSLGGNPWNCDCGLIWFRHWFLTTNVTITDKDDYSCSFGSRDSLNKKLKYLRHPTMLECFKTSQDWWLVIVSTLTFFISSTVLVASLLRRFRWHVKYWIFLNAVMYIVH